MAFPDRAGRGLAELAARYSLTEPMVEQLRCLLDLVATDPRAPTAVRDPQRAVEDHVADSLVALDLAELSTSGLRLVDIGSGAGFPGLPLAVALPNTEVVLLEAASRKSEFISSGIARCGIVNASVVARRAEDWAEGLGQFDFATARAVSSFDVVLEYTAPLLRPGGRLIAWRGRRDLEAEARAARAAADLGLELGEVRPVRPFARASHRHLHIVRKVEETPERFPRRPGVAAKRPLGGR